MPRHRYTAGQLDWPKYLADLRAYQDAEQLSNTALAKRLHISISTLTRYYQAEREPTSEVFAFSVLLMGRELRDYVRELPHVA